MKRPHSSHLNLAKAKKKKPFISLFPIDVRDINSEKKWNKMKQEREDDSKIFSSKMIYKFQRFSSSKGFYRFIIIMLIKISQRAENNS